MELPSFEEMSAALESPVIPYEDKEDIREEEAGDMQGNTAILLDILEKVTEIKYGMEQARAPQAPSLGTISQQLDSF